MPSRLPHRTGRGLGLVQLARLASVQSFPLRRGDPSVRDVRWLSIINEPLSASDLQRLRHSVTRGRPFGDDGWTRETAQWLGLESCLRPRGHPRKTESRNALCPAFLCYVPLSYVRDACPILISPEFAQAVRYGVPGTPEAVRYGVPGTPAGSRLWSTASPRRHIPAERPVTPKTPPGGSRGMGSGDSISIGDGAMAHREAASSSAFASARPTVPELELRHSRPCGYKILQTTHLDRQPLRGVVCLSNKAVAPGQPEV